MNALKLKTALARGHAQLADAGGPAAKRVGPLRHFGGLALAGLAALAVDLGVLWALMAIGIPALLGRLASIAIAMVVSWLINRSVSFAVDAPPNMREFGKFAAVSWSAQAVNYVVFSVVLLTVPAIGAAVSVLVGCAVSIFVAYAGFRFAVFGESAGSAQSPEPDQQKNAPNPTPIDPNSVERT
ncbi:MAG: GtrA family protein [Pseudomonadota bacterium]